MQSNRSTFLILALIVFLSTVNFAFAEKEIVWDENGVAIRQGYHIEWQRAGAIDEDGYVLYIWSDTRESERNVYAQLFAPDGTQEWGDEGNVIVAAPIRQEDPDVIADGFGNFLVSWVDYRADEWGDVWAQKIDRNGNQLWSPQGVPLCTVDTTMATNPFSLTLHTMPDGLGGAIVVWNDGRSGDDGDLYAHHVLENGQVDPQWPVNGLLVAGGSGGQGGPGNQTVDSDGNGGVWVGYTDTRVSGDPNIYLQHVDRDGNLMTPYNVGIPIAIVPDYQENVKLAPDGSGGVYMVWKDRRNYGVSAEDLYFQHVDASGNATLAANGIPFVTQPYDQNGARIVNDGEGNAIVIWQDSRSGDLANDIYSQKIDMQGNVLWGANDLLVCDAPGKQLYVRLNTDGNGGAVAVWTDERFAEYPLGDIYAQQLLSNGTVGWEANGIAVCEDDFLQENPLVRTHTDGTSFIAWADFRKGSVGIFTQVYNSSGTPLYEENGVQIVWGIDGNAENVQFLKLSAASDKYMVVWDDFRSGTNYGQFIYQQIIDIDGINWLPFNGVPVCIKYENFGQVMSGGQSEPKLVSDSEGGAIVCWIDHRIANTNDQIYAQRVDGYGGFVWDSLGVRLLPTEVSQVYNKICEDGSGGAYIAFSAYEENYDLKARVVHIDGSGNILGSIYLSDAVDVDENLLEIQADNNGGAYVFWQGGGWIDYNIYGARITAPCDTAWTMEVCNEPGYQQDLKAVVNDNDEAIVVWEDFRSQIDWDLYAQSIALDGSVAWGVNGTPVIVNEQDQLLGSLALDTDDNLYVVWEDLRSLSVNDVYMQKINGVSGANIFQDTGVPVVVVTEGDQSNPMVHASNDGLYVAWEDYRYIKPDYYGVAMTYDGQILEDWTEGGEPICDFNLAQKEHIVIDDEHGGVISAWKDFRSSGKSELFNIYSQRWRDNSWYLSVDQIVSNLNPSEFDLSQNYPNPFNPKTKIRFNLPESGNVKLTIFNALGQEVNVLVDKYLSAGSHEADWDGSSFSGDFSASGIYYYKLELNDNTKVMKMLMLK